MTARQGCADESKERVPALGDSKAWERYQGTKGSFSFFFLPFKVALVETVSKENLADIHRISDGLMSSGVWTCGNADKAC
jgi:hypothetical protein